MKAKKMAAAKACAAEKAWDEADAEADERSKADAADKADGEAAAADAKVKSAEAAAASAGGDPEAKKNSQGLCGQQSLANHLNMSRPLHHYPQY